MNERPISEQILILDTLIKERESIIENIKDEIKTGKRWMEDHWERALDNQIENHKIAIQEYKEGLEKLNG